jgi:hypothetical protein
MSRRSSSCAIQRVENNKTKQKWEMKSHGNEQESFSAEYGKWVKNLCERKVVSMCSHFERFSSNENYFES